MVQYSPKLRSKNPLSARVDVVDGNRLAADDPSEEHYRYVDRIEKCEHANIHPHCISIGLAILRRGPCTYEMRNRLTYHQQDPQALEKHTNYTDRCDLLLPNLLGNIGSLTFRPGLFKPGSILGIFVENPLQT
jgi:hypothetical protein